MKSVGTNRAEKIRPHLQLPDHAMGSEQTAYKHARMEVSERMIGFYDLNGATALERGTHVAMFNIRHFGQIKGLSVIEPK